MDGLLIIDKPAGMTSHDVVARVRRVLGVRRVGHSGTLDPFATGVLVVLVGRAVRLAQFLSGAEKEYEAVIRLGFATDTGDVTGTPRLPDSSGTAPFSPPAEAPAREFSDQEIEAALATLCGKIEQVPPMYSAKKHQGKKLYELARRGEQIERRPVPVTVHSFAVVSNEDSSSWLQGLAPAPNTRDLAVRVVCSAGTYVRTLAEDFGRRLGVGAHLAALRRTRAGDFSISESLTLDQLREKSERGALVPILLPPEAALSHLPFAHLTTADAHRARNGLAIRMAAEPETQWPEGEQVRMHAEDGRLIGVAVFVKANRTLHPRVVIDVEK